MGGKLELIKIETPDAERMGEFRKLWVKSMMEMRGVPGKYLNSPGEMKYIAGVDPAEPGGDITAYHTEAEENILKP